MDAGSNDDVTLDAKTPHYRGLVAFRVPGRVQEGGGIQVPDCDEAAYFYRLPEGGVTMNEAKWYFAHESKQDRMWCRTFFPMCRKLGISGPEAALAQRAFIEEIACVN